MHQVRVKEEASEGIAGLHRIVREPVFQENAFLDDQSVLRRADVHEGVGEDQPIRRPGKALRRVLASVWDEHGSAWTLSIKEERGEYEGVRQPCTSSSERR